MNISATVFHLWLRNTRVHIRSTNTAVSFNSVVCRLWIAKTHRRKFCSGLTSASLCTESKTTKTNKTRSSDPAMNKKWSANKTCWLSDSSAYSHFNFAALYKSARQIKMVKVLNSVPLLQCPPHTQGSGSSALCSYIPSTLDSYLHKWILNTQAKTCEDLFIPLWSTLHQVFTSSFRLVSVGPTLTCFHA